MRLLTHNITKCNVKGCNKNNYPLRIKAENVQKIESEFNGDFVVNMIPKIEWDALVQGARDIEVTVPETLPENAVEDEEFLKSLHNVISDIHIIEAELSCENCGRVYKISEGIPNMLLNDDEV